MRDEEADMADPAVADQVRDQASSADYIGTLYATDINQESRSLLDEINSNGHMFNLTKTRLEHKSPYIRTSRAEVVGAEAIRRYLKL